MEQLRDRLAIRINLVLSGYPQYFTTPERVKYANIISRDVEQTIQARLSTPADIKGSIERTIKNTIDWSSHAISIPDVTEIQTRIKRTIGEEMEWNFL